MKVLVAEEISDAGVGLLTGAGLSVDVRLGLSASELLEVIGDYEGLIVRSATKVTEEVLEAGSKLKVIGRAGVGVDNVDVEAATRRGILVANAPTSNVISAAEHTVALILAMARRIPEAHSSLTGGKWERSRLEGMELHDKTLGVIGLGRIGTLVAQRCLAFGMRVVAYDPYISDQRAAQLGIRPATMDEVFALADIITLHVPKNAQTMDLIDASTLAKCRDGVRIVNVARGGIVNESDLADAVRSGKVAGAAVDVFDVEPKTDSPLFSLPQVVVTPHLAGSTQEAQDKAGTTIAEQVLLAIQGEFVPYAVNMQAGSGLAEWLRPYLGLARRLGRLSSALAAEKAVSINVAYTGRIAEEDTRAITLAALRGFLEPTTSEPVTFVNAPLIASDRGLEWGESRSTHSDEFSSLVRITASRPEAEDVTVAATLVGDVPRLVEVDGRGMEMTLAGNLLLFRYADVPGVVHNLTGPLAKSGINIRNMVVAECEDGQGEAILAMTVDRPVDDQTFSDAKNAAGITSGRFISLEGV